MQQIQRFMGYCLALRERRAVGQQAVFTSLGIRKLPVPHYCASSQTTVSDTVTCSTHTFPSFMDNVCFNEHFHFPQSMAGLPCVLGLNR